MCLVHLFNLPSGVWAQILPWGNSLTSLPAGCITFILPQPQENKSFLLGQWYCGYEQGLFSFVSSLKGINHVLTSDLSICVASCVLYAVKKSELFFVSRGVTVHAYPGLTDADLAKTASEALFIQLLLGSSSAMLPTSCSRDAIACWVVCMSYKTRLTLRSNFRFFHH